MSATRASSLMSVSDFFVFLDARQGEKWELVEGHPVAMAGGTVRHALISANIAEAVGPSARKLGCRALRDLFVSVAANDHQLFDPDVLIRCDPADETARSIDDPVAVFEVLSPSTMARDRGVKFDAYTHMASLRFIALVYSAEERVEVRSREAGAPWPEAPAIYPSAGHSIPVPPIASDLALADIYANA
jgi:Uma2 family endonuclease